MTRMSCELRCMTSSRKIHYSGNDGTVSCLAWGVKLYENTVRIIPRTQLEHLSRFGHSGSVEWCWLGQEEYAATYYFQVVTNSQGRLRHAIDISPQEVVRPMRSHPFNVEKIDIKSEPITTSPCLSMKIVRTDLQGPQKLCFPDILNISV